MQTIVLYMLLTAALYYLGSRAVITRPLWSRYPRQLAVFFDCASCSGFWYGVIVHLALRQPFLGLGDDWYIAPVVGLAALVWTPIAAGIMQVYFERLGTAVGDMENHDEDEK